MNTTTPEQTFVRVRAIPGARREHVQQRPSGIWDISVTEKTQRGEANARIREVLATQLGIPKRALRLVKGAKLPSKTFVFIK